MAYIDRDKLIERIVSTPSECCKLSQTIPFLNGSAARQNEIIDLIEAEPVYDMVGVVRCKNCKHRPISTIEGEDYGFSLEPPDDDWRCPCLNGDDGWYSWMPEDDFYCANGERRTEDE